MITPSRVLIEVATSLTAFLVSTFVLALASAFTVNPFGAMDFSLPTATVLSTSKASMKTLTNFIELLIVLVYRIIELLDLAS